MNINVSSDTEIYDIIVIGGGPAGYTAALYAARAGLDTVIVERIAAGGQMSQTDMIDNYPGFEDGIDGVSLGDKMRRGAERFGVQSRYAEVVSVDFSSDIKSVETTEGILYGRCVIVATGANPRKLGLANEESLVGRGVSYCATCDGMFYKNKTAVVVGGGNSAVEDALVLSRVCKEVILVHRRDTLRATKIYHDSLMKANNVRLVWDSEVVEILADKRVSGVRIKNVKTEEEHEILCDGLFVSIGREPATELVRGKLELDAGGYIIADESTRTGVGGVFAAGDVRTKAVRQIVTATADGAVAVYYAEEYLAKK